MAPPLTSHETAEFINVSQGVISSPTAKGSVESDTYSERVEDSIPNGTTAARGPVVPDTYSDHVEASFPEGNVVTALPATVEETQAASDHDELYALSPNGKAARELAKAALVDVTVYADVRRNGERDGNDDVGMIKTQTVQKPAPRSAIDDLLEQGATAHSIRREKSSVKTSSREVAGEGMCLRFSSCAVADEPTSQPVARCE